MSIWRETLRQSDWRESKLKWRRRKWRKGKWRKRESLPGLQPPIESRKGSPSSNFFDEFPAPMGSEDSVVDSDSIHDKD